ncbi:MAG: cryptochrome/photolyase family protein [Gammaproteobacteria bacterium]|nr:cryptochrome/photolyase family protein [Gammaproteobacteria bacterium]
MSTIRRLVVVLGDQLDPEAPWHDGFEPARDAVWMAEVAGEARRVWSHKARIALFLTAMRHHRDALRARGVTVHYRALEDGPAPEDSSGDSLAAALDRFLADARVSEMVMVEAGEWGVAGAIAGVAGAHGLQLTVLPDPHFLVSRDRFAAWAQGRQQLRMEFFYRDQRRRLGVLMDGTGPVGGQWNFDRANRRSFGRHGPGLLVPPRRFPPDALTREVIGLVRQRFADHPGRLDEFDWPVTPEQAREALADFIAERLPGFGAHQDAMWTGQPWLSHARLSAAMNLKLLSPAEVIAAAEQAFRDGHAPIESVEGFIRQVLGWREYVRGIYWRHMPDYLDVNALDADRPLPGFYWTAATDMNCLREVIGQTLGHGYAHHIQRLMVTGLFALLAGIRPREVHEWYLAIYVDAVEWVEAPNTIGMALHADGGVMASKPYVASGKYIQRMSNYCDGCRYDPGRSVGEGACPFTTLYWRFLIRHANRFAEHPRTALQWRNLARIDRATQARIVRQGDALLDSLGV